MNVYRTAAATMLASVLTLAALPAQAQNARSFVSSKGLDTNSCILQAPCRTFQRAHDVTNANGEIDVLDTAGYGPVAITKGISIINDGAGVASMVAPASGAGITVNATANDKVTLRGLTIDGGGNANAKGINFINGKSLTITNCTVRNVYDGLYFFPPAFRALYVVDSNFSENSNDGMNLNFASGTIQRVSATGNGANGIEIHSSYLNLKSLDLSQNASAGLRGVVNAVTNIESSTFNLNVTGISAFTGSVMRLTRSIVGNNSTGIAQDTPQGGYVISFGDNMVDGNTTNVSGGALIVGTYQ